MGFSGNQLLPEAIQPGEEFDVTIHLTSPTAPGTYTGYFMLADAKGMRFGSGVLSDQPFYVQITVIGHDGLAITPSASTSQYIPGTIHLVSKNDSLQGIAIRYHVDIEDIRIANGMVGDAILAGQRLFVPKPGQSLRRLPYQFSITEGATDTDYPLTLSTNRFTLHYSPETYPATDPQIISSLVERSINNAERIFSKSLPYRFDVYVAGSLFAPPERILRGRSFSRQLRYHFLHDGTGNAEDQQYIASHELTHLFAWNVFGVPVSTMLSEGAAVYSGMNAILDSDYLSLDTFCAAFLQAGELPRISSSLSFQGHNLDLQNYYAAGSFVGYLIRTYGTESFGRLYSTGDFTGIYQRSLPSLEEDWRQYLTSVPIPEGLDPTRLVSSVKDVTSEYGQFFPIFQGTNNQIAAYRELDKARLALLVGNLDTVATQLDRYQKALSISP
jgi:LysM repeat protein